MSGSTCGRVRAEMKLPGQSTEEVVEEGGVDLKWTHWLDTAILVTFPTPPYVIYSSLRGLRYQILYVMLQIKLEMLGFWPRLT